MGCLLKWKAPQSGMKKGYSDVAVGKENRRIGVGRLVYDHEGEVQATLRERNSTDPTTTEARGGFYQLQSSVVILGYKM